jgi:hypothetical protein
VRRIIIYTGSEYTNTIASIRKRALFSLLTSILLPDFTQVLVGVEDTAKRQHGPGDDDGVDLGLAFDPNFSSEDI